jgi:hypothetical protein
MVAIRFKSPDQTGDGSMLLTREGAVRTLPGEIYVCRESALGVLDAINIPYEKLPLPLSLDEVGALRDTPTTAL